MLSISIYTNNLVSKELFNKIKSAIENIENEKSSDFFIFTDDIINVINYDIAILPSIYMEFHKDIIIFMNVDDYLSYREKLISNSIYLFMQDGSVSEMINRQMLRGIKSIITLSKNDQIKMVKP